MQDLKPSTLRAPARSYALCKPLAHAAMLVCLGAGAALAVLPQHARAQQSASRDYQIGAGTLDQALNRFASTAGITLSIDGSLTAGKTSPGLNGSYGLRQGLDALLEGTGLRAVRQPNGSYTLQPVPKPSASGGVAQLSEVVVTGNAERGSATENTGSYTARAVAAGSKMEQPLREVPRSISVLGREQMDDQRLTQLNEAMEQLGVIMSPNQGGWGNVGYSTRSYNLTGVTIDGSPVKDFFVGGDSSLNTGLAKFDSVQLVRGPEGLFTGNGSPGGSINLVRKRPLRDFQLKGALSAGSWNNYLGLLDVSSPLNASGSVRGRAVASYNDTEKFYDNAHRKYSTLYGIIEADLSPRTTLTAGASYDKVDGSGQDAPPDFPRYSTGDPLPLSRSLGYPNFAARNSESTNLFAGLEHSFSPEWKGRLNLSQTRSRGYTAAISYNGYAGAGVDPVTGEGASIWAPRANSWESSAFAADFNIQGETSIWGREYKLVVGADFVDTDVDYSQVRTFLSYPGISDSTFSLPIDWNTFDPSLVGMTDERPIAEILNQKSRQYGAYLYNSLQVYGPVRVIVGGRLSGFRSDNTNDNRVGNTFSQTSRKDSRIFTPYYAVQLDISNDWTAYATLARGFEDQSNLYSADYQPLGPTRSRSMELGLKGEHWDGRLNTQFTVYRSRRDNFAVSLDSDPAFNEANPGKSCCFAGDGRFTGRGFEFDINGELLKGLQVNFGYTLDDSKIDYGSSQGQRMSTNMPKHIFRAWVRYNLPSGLGAWSRLAVGGGVIARSSFYAQGTVSTWNPTGGPDGEGAFDGPKVDYKFYEPGRAVWNLFAEYRIDPQWLLALNVNNVFDKKYLAYVGSTTAGNTFGEPRNVMLTLRGSF